MATLLKKPVIRKCDKPLSHSGRNLIVTLLPGDMIAMREEGKRTTYTGSLEKIYWVLAKWYALDGQKRKQEDKELRRIERDS